MSKLQATRKALLLQYEEWAALAAKLKDGAFLSKEYSNPYYLSIPDDWFEADVRVMIVGEEGYGEWGCGKQYGWTSKDSPWKFTDYEKIIEYNRIKRLTQLNPDSLRIEERTLCRMTKSKFWQRFENAYKAQESGSYKASFIWNNFDKIHLRSNANCQLSAADRKLLHQNTILAKEIQLLNPHVVIFFGWRSGSALKAELGDVYEKLYVHGKYDNSRWQEKIDIVETKERAYVFTYHPERKTALYGKTVDAQIKETLARIAKRNNPIIEG